MINKIIIFNDDSILQILGTPTKDELKAMNPNYQEFKFPQIRAQPFGNMFNDSVPPEAIDLASTLLFYVPTRRCKAIEVKTYCIIGPRIKILSIMIILPMQACGHAFFDELRLPSATLPDRSPIPLSMFQFTDEEISLAPGMASVLTPTHMIARIQESSSTARSSSLQAMEGISPEQASTSSSAAAAHTVAGIVEIAPSAIEEGSSTL